MITLNQLLDAAQARIKAALPEYAIYRNYVPHDFKRPSVLISAGPMEMQVASYQALEVICELEVTGFVKVDARHNSQIEQLAELAQLLHGIMTNVTDARRAGTLAVGGRYLHIEKSSMDYQFDFCTLMLTLTYQDERMTDEQLHQLMQEYQLRLQHAAE